MPTPSTVTYIIANYDQSGNVVDTDYLNCEEQNKEDEITEYLFENYTANQIKNKQVRVFILDQRTEVDFSINISHPKPFREENEG